MNTDDILDKIYDKRAIAERIEIKRKRIEETGVKRILSTFGLGDQVKVLCNLAKEATGEAKLLFSWFIDEYPSFPMSNLKFVSIPYVHKTSIPDLLFNFNKTRIYKKLLNTFELDIDSSNPFFGMVFPWAKFKGQLVMVHNDLSMLYDTYEEPEITLVKLTNTQNQDVYVLQSFNSFLYHISDQWTP